MRLLASFAGASAVVLAAGVVLAQAADALAAQSGLGASFVGVTLLATATSLPELSTTIAAVRLGAYSLAVSNIFGSNMLMVALVFLADLVYRPGPVLAAVDRSAVFAVAMGIVVTAVYLIGLIERRDRTILRMGLDSAVVLALYVGSLGVLYLLR
jgi:cation:H+ antiporter